MPEPTNRSRLSSLTTEEHGTFDDAQDLLRRIERMPDRTVPRNEARAIGPADEH